MFLSAASGRRLPQRLFGVTHQQRSRSSGLSFRNIDLFAFSIWPNQYQQHPVTTSNSSLARLATKLAVSVSISISTTTESQIKRAPGSWPLSAEQAMSPTVSKRVSSDPLARRPQGHPFGSRRINQCRSLPQTAQPLGL